MAMSRGHFLERKLFANNRRRRAWRRPRSVVEGDGTGKLRRCRGHESWVKVFGRARGAALATSMKMGVLTGRDTKRHSTRLFQNVTANQGCACA